MGMGDTRWFTRSESSAQLPLSNVFLTKPGRGTANVHVAFILRRPHLNEYPMCAWESLEASHKSCSRAVATLIPTHHTVSKSVATAWLHDLWEASSAMLIFNCWSHGSCGKRS